ncbi:MAG: aminoglycoside phosphotransferase family protein, partial [Candidatus Izimaplasma sp.]|nr:aminoglycoside phosphotransferase family protein [Candidatus Izimaplasma bacterium]
MNTLIGEGKTAKVYSDNQFAYKVYNKNFNKNYINYEVNIQNEIYTKTKINVCKYEYNGIDNFVKMTLVKGISLADRIRNEAYKEWLSDLIELQISVYQYNELDIPNAYEMYEKQIYNSHFDKSLRDKALSILKSTKRVYVLCHLDFHPENILYNGNHYIIIDWMNAKLANPIMDIARTYIILKQYMKDQSENYLKLISEKMGLEEKEIKEVVPLMAFLRLKEN